MGCADHLFETLVQHPHLSNVKCLRIWDRHDFLALGQLPRIAEAARFFKFVGLWGSWFLISMISDCSSLFSDLLEFQDLMQPDAFSSIDGLAVACTTTGLVL